MLHTVYDVTKCRVECQIEKVVTNCEDLDTFSDDIIINN